jgi:hypothetical protein
MLMIAMSASPGVLAGGGEDIWPRANPAQQSTKEIPNNDLRQRISFPPVEAQFTTVFSPQSPH